MKKNFLVFLLAGVSFAGLTSCEDNKTEQKAEQKTEVSEESVVAAATPAEETNNVTSIDFGSKEHDFGVIVQGEMVGHTFLFKNTGDKPLTIIDAKASCGCTVPEWSKEPIAPGEEGKLEVKYNGSGSGVVRKTVTVIANTEPAETILEIKANVRELNGKGPFKE